MSEKKEEIIQSQKASEQIPEYKPSVVKILNVVVVILVLILIIVLWIPVEIQKEVESIRRVGRERMSVLNEVEKYYKGMTGVYQSDPILAMKVLSAVRDSTRADSNFHGEQKVYLPEGIFEMDVTKNFYRVFDTTFAYSYQRQDTVFDTSYQVVIWNEDIFSHDTIFVHSSRIGEIKESPNFREVTKYEINPRVATNTYYIPYNLDSSFAYSPLISEQYKIMIDTQGIIIKDPLEGEYKESRYLVFAFKDTSHGWIKNREKSWEKR